MPSIPANLAAAPHRPLFLAGAVQGVAVMLWWWLELESRFAAWPGLPTPVLPAPAAHAWLMLYGFFPFFIFGFLFTALPNWVNGRAIRRRVYLTTALPMAAGAALFYPGLFQPGLAAAALLLHGLGWAIGLAALLRILVSAPPGDNRQPWIAWGAILVGWLGNLAFLLWQLSGAPALLALAESLGVWGFLTPLFLAVCHRMIPWFTSRVVANYVMVRPYCPLWSMLAASLAHALLEAVGRPEWTWPADLALAGLAFWFLTRWGIARAFSRNTPGRPKCFLHPLGGQAGCSPALGALRVRLLAMLHVAFVWAGAAFALSAVASLSLFLGIGGGLGQAPLHALGVGFFGAMLVGMASRVSLGHSGRPLEADGLTWAIFWVVQGAALLRLLPDLLPAVLPYRLVALAALVWLLAFGLWAWKYAPYFWRPRADGKPG